MKNRWKKNGYRMLVTLAWISVTVFFLWAVGTTYYLTLLPRPMAGLLSLAYLTVGVTSWWRHRKRGKANRWLSLAALSIIAIYAASVLQRPSNDRDWVAEQARPSQVITQDGEVTIKNFRNCHYRSELDFDVHYDDEMRFRREQLTSVWFIVQKFTALEGVAHTMLSFEIGDTDEEGNGDVGEGARYFSVSVEVRREQSEVFSPIRGLYRQFELIYVVGDERDLLGSRTNMRSSDRVYLYRVNATAEQTQLLFDDIAARVNGLHSRPEFYHTLLSNCTNAIVSHTYELTPDPIRWLDPRIVMPGFSDSYAHSRGLIGQTGQNLTDLRKQSRVDVIAKEIGLPDDFSIRIRKSLESRQ